jgi:hypothetical protein
MEARANICNWLHGLLLAYVPKLSGSETTEESRQEILKMEKGHLRDLLICLTSWIELNEVILYRQQEPGSIGPDIDGLKYIAGEMKPWRIFMYQMDNRKRRIKKIIWDHVGRIRWKR